MEITKKEFKEVFGVNEDNVIEIDKWYNFCTHTIQTGITYVEVIKHKKITKFDRLIGKHYDNKNKKELLIYNVDGILKGYFRNLKSKEI